MDRDIQARELLKRILQGIAPPRPLFLPIVFSHAARVENLPLRIFLSNPTKITQALRQVRAHLRSDGVTCYFDPYLELEALGGIVEWNAGEQPSVRWGRNPVNGDLPDGLRTLEELPGRGRIPVAVEVIRRLKSLVPDDCLLTVGINGPFAVAARLMAAGPGGSSGTEVSSAALELASGAIAPVATAFVEAGANVVFIREELPLAASVSVDLAAQLATAINIVRFYQALPVLLFRVGAQYLNLALRQSLDCVVCPVFTETLPNMPAEWIELTPTNLAFPIPLEVIAESQPTFEKSAEQLRRVVQMLQPPLITTSEDVPDTADLKNLNKLRDFLIA